MESIIHSKLKTFINKNRCTLLGVGPMSVNCVNASIELSNTHKIPILLIASSQIDSKDFEGAMLIIGVQKNSPIMLKRETKKI